MDPLKSGIKTSEGMGAVGRGEGIEVHAVASIGGA